MPELAVHGPLDETDLHDDGRSDPVGAETGKALGLRERRLRDFERVEPRAQVEQQLCVETGADLAGKDEVLSFVIADEQGAEADARALRIGEPADYELLRRLAFHLEPQRRAPLLVGRAAALGDDAFPSFPG